MKKLFFALYIVCILMGCDNGDMNDEPKNPFVGTWVTSADTSSQLPKKIVFTDDEISGYDEDNNIFSFIGMMPPPIPNVTIEWQGTYTYDDTQIIMQFLAKVTFPYTFENGKLLLSGCPYIKN